MSAPELKVDGKCQRCRFRDVTALFELCTHAASSYTADGREGQHTVTHMRNRGGCGEAAIHFQAAA